MVPIDKAASVANTLAAFILMLDQCQIASLVGIS